jgi:hypothetical protein
MRVTKTLLLTLTVLSLPIEAALPVAEAAQSGFDPRIIAVGEARDQIKSKPIEQRPNRPLHVYGNTIRRRHSRGNATPR